MPEVGDPAPDFTLPSTEGELHLSDQISKGKILLAFYYEDSTPTCSSELSVFKKDYDLIDELGAQVVAVSADTLDSHRDFVDRLGGLPFPLAADENLEAANAYGVVDDSGRRSRRAVFVIDGDGAIAHVEPWFQPGNPAQYEAIFRALGIGK
jgi:peroxiredoxin Q/BCP